MQNFANQCLDMAHSILGHNLSAIKEDGSVAPVENEPFLQEEGAHAFAAIGEFYRATHETQVDSFDIIDLGARCLTAQAFVAVENSRALAYSSLGLLAFGPAKQRNLVWERLLEPTRVQLDKKLLARTDAVGQDQAFNIAKAVARYSMGLTKKDDTGKLIDRFLERIQLNSTNGYFADEDEQGSTGIFDISGLMSFIFIRQALKMHVNLHLCERKLPSIRTYAEKYLRMLPDIVRSDGLGWAYGRGVGVYGQIYCISMILQAMRDGWIAEEKKELYLDCLRRLFQYFFVTYMDQEHGFLVVRDDERTALSYQTTRTVSFDAARYLSQWSRLAKTIGAKLNANSVLGKTGGRFICFDKSSQKERGLFIYQDAASGLQVQLPLVSSHGKSDESDSLAFPHCPGIFDWPVNLYLPVFVPELTFEQNIKTLPCFYGKHCATGLGLRNSYYFRYEQPELITNDEKIIDGIGSCKVNWSFTKSTVSAEFIYTVKQPIQLLNFRYIIPIAAPHSRYRLENSFTLGENSLQATVNRDDFQGEWTPVQIVKDDPNYKTYYGKIYYLQVLERTTPLLMQPGKEYKLHITLEPDIALIGG